MKKISKYLLCVLVFSLLPYFLYAQRGFISELSDGQVYKVMDTPASIYPEPVFQNPLKPLALHDEVEILERLKTSEERNTVWAYWYKVKHNDTAGYLWGGCLAEKDYSFPVDARSTIARFYYRWSNAGVDFPEMDTDKDIFIFINNRKMNLKEFFTYVNMPNPLLDRKYTSIYMDSYRDGTILMQFIQFESPVSGIRETYLIKNRRTTFLGSHYYYNEDLTQRMYVNSPEGLRVRDNPGLNGNRIGLLENQTVIAVHPWPRKDEDVIIDGIKGRWVYIGQGGINGWVFDGYLRPEPIEEKIMIEHLKGLWFVTEMNGENYSDYSEDQKSYFRFNDDGTYVFKQGTSNFQWRSGYYRYNYNINKLRFWSVKNMMEGQIPWDYYEDVKIVDPDHIIFTYRNGRVIKIYRNYNEEFEKSRH